MGTKGERIKRNRELANLTRTQLAKLTGLSVSAISGYERGDFEPKTEVCHKIAAALNLPADAILDMPPGSGYDNPQPYVTKKLPLLGKIPAGPAVDTWEIVEWVDVLMHDYAPNRFVLRVEGDSMVPLIFDRDLVIIETGETITLERADHKICAVEIDGEKTLKYVDVEWRGGRAIKVVIKPRNDRYKPIEILPEKFNRLRIVGIAIKITERYL